MLHPQEIYAEQLGHGFPLWQANPFTEPPVDVGDVGYISDRGGWAKLFNVAKPSDDISNPYGLPNALGRIEIGRTEAGSLSASRAIFSRSVRSLGADIDMSNT